jgi:putative ABC transport system substrate-binding protein
MKPLTVSTSMLNHSKKTALCISGIVFLALLLALPCFAADTRRPKQVVFVRYNLKDEPNSTIVREFKKTMEERGYAEGKDIHYIDFVTRNSERESAEEILHIADKYLMDGADMFITSGWTSLYVRSRLAKSKVPQLFTPALKASALNMLPSVETEPNTNLSGVYLTYPPEKVLRLTRHILSGITKYAYVYDSRIPADIIFKAAYGQLNEHERYGMTVYFLDLAAGTDTVLQKMNKMGVEAFGGAVGVLKNLADLSQSRLPIITSLLFDRGEESLADSIRQSNIIAALFNPFDDCARKAAHMTADIFDAKTTIEKTIPQPAKQLAVINLIAAKRLDIPIPFSALEAVDIVLK